MPQLAYNNKNNVLGNPKLLTKMMKGANLFVQSLSGHSNDTSSSNDNDDDDDNDNGEDDNNNEGGSSTTQKRTKTKSRSSDEDISFVRIRTKRDEILVAPKLGYTLVALQDPNVSSL